MRKKILTTYLQNCSNADSLTERSLSFFELESKLDNYRQVLNVKNARKK